MNAGRMGHILEWLDIHPFFTPDDLNDATGGHVDGDWLRPTGPEFMIVFMAGLGTAASDPTLTIRQATAAAGTGAKSLNFTVIYTMEALDVDVLTSLHTWTKTTQSAGNTYTHGTSAESALVWAVPFSVGDLDVDGGFCFVNATVADCGAAKLGTCFLINTLFDGGPAANHATMIA